MLSKTSTPPVIQGTLVSFEFPQDSAMGRELSRGQLGVVISHSLYASGENKNVIVTPLLRLDSPHNRELGIPVSSGGLQGWLRPDLTRTVAKALCTPRNASSGKRWVVPEDAVHSTITTLLDMVGPTPQKINERRASFNPRKVQTDGGRVTLRYGEVAFFDSIPYSDKPWMADRTSGLCLTPPSVSEKTGIVLVSRRYGQINNFLPPRDVAAVTPGFGLGYHTASSIQALSLDRVEKTSKLPEQSKQPVLDLRALKAYWHKLAACLLESEFRKTAIRYPHKHGQLPDFIQSAWRL